MRTYIHDGGTLANVHFLAIPFNANAPDAARVVADFMLSPEAQIRKADARIWGDPTVLSMARLTAADKAAFDALPRGVATLSEADLGKTRLSRIRLDGHQRRGKPAAAGNSRRSLSIRSARLTT